MATPITPNLANGESADWKAKVPQVVADINAAIAEIDADLAGWAGYTNVQVKDATERVLNHQRKLLVIQRKIANLLTRLL